MSDLEELRTRILQARAGVIPHDAVSTEEIREALAQLRRNPPTERKTAAKKAAAAVEAPATGLLARLRAMDQNI